MINKDRLGMIEISNELAGSDTMFAIMDVVDLVGDVIIKPSSKVYKCRCEQFDKVIEGEEIPCYTATPVGDGYIQFQREWKGGPVTPRPTWMPPMPQVVPPRKDTLILQMVHAVKENDWDNIVEALRESISKQTDKEVIILPNRIKLIDIK